jgi:16S rRNA (guanine966-N2)-methyltransferase
MRIIAGSAKGKTLNSPPDTRTRPTSDRAREGLFSSLSSDFNSITGLNFLDLFAGSGAVGVEALSRGAAIVHSVESEGDLGNVAISNFQLVKSAAGSYRVFHTKVERFLESEHAAEKGRYDIIFMDPPYDLPNSEIEHLLSMIIEKDLLQPLGIVAIERESKGKAFTWPEHMQEIKVRSYGQGSIYYGGYSASVLP